MGLWRLIRVCAPVRSLPRGVQVESVVEELVARVQILELEIGGELFPLYYLLAKDFPDSVVDQVAAHLREDRRIPIKAHHGAVQLPAEQLEHFDPVGGLELDSKSAEARHVLGPEQLQGLRLEAQPTDHEILLRSRLRRPARLTREHLYLHRIVELDVYVNEEVLVLYRIGKGGRAQECPLVPVQQVVEVLVVVALQV